VSLNDWILALHLLAAFALVGAEVVFSIMIAALWGTDSTARVTSFTTISRIATVLLLVGTAGTIVFGVWLAISKEPYDLWDGWVIAAIVLWAVATGLGQRAGTGYGSTAMEAAKLAESGTATSPAVAETFGASRAFWFHVAGTAVVILILIDMIWKPGA
jgi:uncharacterized membrane protein